jgi:CxxC motif-containing protein (DUF1111 family)
MRWVLVSVCALSASLSAWGCSSSSSPPSANGSPDSGAPDEPSTLARASDVPIDGVSQEQVIAFRKGDGVFDLPFRDADGLGPYYVRSSCGACHEGGSRGPGLVQKMVVVQSDGVTPDADQSLLPYGHTIRLGLSAGAKTPLAAPMDPRVKVTVRLGPPILGRGYMEAVLDSEIERMESEQSKRTDGIHGKINHVAYASEANEKGFFKYVKGQMVIGRFGLKARVATLDDFTADAFQGDMGLTTPMRPDELANPDMLTDDLRKGVDLDLDHVNEVAEYLRLVAIPRRSLDDAGRAAFDKALCSVCHVPSLKTRADYPIAQLAGIDAPVYTDFLLHDLGDKLADGMTDGSADARAWRTAPLIGMRFQKVFMHDGRSPSIEQAILAHEGEAKVSADAFKALTADERAKVIAYVEAL